MSYAGDSAAAVFTFDDQGRPTLISADRFNDSTGTLERWSIPILDFGEFDGFRIPIEGLGTWHLQSGDFTYIRWRVTEIDINKASTLVRGGA